MIVARPLVVKPQLLINVMPKCSPHKSDTAPTWTLWFHYTQRAHRKLTVELDTIDLRAAYPMLNSTS
ncbi:hypothetical protein GCM10017044_28660 [Kordiimonas sediminis]|uniref:Uncharacterized protein n=1 Tax=Kordiimonas sediminis TaxID=1735581 RepID=A0A919EAX9_9PROT|nr:hypothetical protein GCM10017044_28660 [Kordiimonas sediminis]